MTSNRSTYNSPDPIPGMPSTDAYQALLTKQSNCVRENHANTSFAFSERHLQCVWENSRLRPTSLTTRNGETLSIVDPGHWNLEAGPDFLDAVLLLGPERRRIQGDIEIHISPADWDHHKHSGDPRYRRVIAHVTYSPGNAPLQSLPRGTVEISLQEALTTTPGFSFESIDITAYPYATLPHSPRPCALALQNWHPDRLGPMLEAAGAHRMQIKANRIAMQLEHATPDAVLYREVLGAFGYKQNTAVCRNIADRITYDVIHSMPPLAGYALLLGISGLLPEKPSPRWDAETREFIRYVWDAWWPQQAQWQNVQLSRSAWTLSSIRPQNHPIRRLAAIAAVACKPDSLSQQFADIPTNAPTLWRKTVAKRFLAPSPLDYWHTHISLGSKRRDKPIAIIGHARLSALSANVFLPYLAATGKPTETLIQTLPPEQNNAIIRQTAHALFGRDHNPLLYSKSGLRQQGIMQIFHDFCLTDRSGCEACPFPLALQRD